MMSASGPGSVASAQHSSQIAKPNRPAAAGSRPSRSGYSSGSGSPFGERSRDPAVARPIARHGLSSRNTSPNSSDRNGMPTQKPT